MEISTAIALSVVLLVRLWVPYYIWYIRRGAGVSGHSFEISAGLAPKKLYCLGTVSGMSSRDDIAWAANNQN
jgi:hypothetical protein